MKKFYIILLLLFINFFAFAEGIIPIPTLNGRVNDLTSTLSQSEISNLENKIKSFEDTSGNQIVILIIPITGDETIEQFSIRLAESWKIGQEGIDNGVILIIAKNDRTIRIEVGYGLESIITDANAITIIDNYIVPNFKNGYFYQGIDFGINEIINLITGNSTLANQPVDNKTKTITPPYDYKKQNKNAVYIIICFFLPILLLFFKNAKWYIKLLILLGIIGFVIYIVLLINLYFVITIFALPLIFFSFIAFEKKSSTTSRSYSTRSYSSNSYNSSSYKSTSSYKSSSSSSYKSSSSSFKGGGGKFGGGGASSKW